MRRVLVVVVVSFFTLIAGSAVAFAADPCVAANGEVRRTSETAFCDAEGRGSVAIAIGDGAYAGVMVPWWGPVGTNNHAIAIADYTSAVIESGSGNQMLAVFGTSYGGGDSNFVMGGYAWGTDNRVMSRDDAAQAGAEGTGNTVIASGPGSSAFATGTDNTSIASGIGSQAYTFGEGNTAIASGDGMCFEGGWCEGGGAAFASGTGSTAVASGDGICTGVYEGIPCEAVAWADASGDGGNTAVASGDGSMASAWGGTDNTAIAEGELSVAIASGDGCTAIATEDGSTVTCP